MNRPAQLNPKDDGGKRRRSYKPQLLGTWESISSELTEYFCLDPDSPFRIGTIRSKLSARNQGRS